MPNFPSPVSGSVAKSLSLRGVTKTYGDAIAVHSLSLDVLPGELVSLLGPSGCGKTTTLRMIAGFEYPDQGDILIDGKEISYLPPNKRGLGMVFQNYSLFPHMTISENIAFGLSMAGVKKPRIQAEVTRMLDLIKLPEHAQKKASQLSGGQQQRVALARAIVTNPSVLLLDEPLGALDKNLRESMQIEIRKLQKELGITSVMVTHDQEEALVMSDRIAVMNQGAILQVGIARDVYERPRTRFVADFLGTANIIPARVEGIYADRWGVALKTLEPRHFDIPRIDNRSITGDIELAVRPEKIAINSGLHEKQAAFNGVVCNHTFRGAHQWYEVLVPELNQTILVSHQPGGVHNVPSPVLHESVVLSFDGRDLVALEPDEA
ncbi:ABC transporter ATP-binding protein [Paralcaligenes ureilyticus]|uniref:Spermidine/putrescine import ATP-binding protein PotA n=1 Tax=Paralcaligenes ureilyticus TaxID=627131 RepID=A0A4R3LWZ3_9BURK|nr:ABC transporter ATP-binding protein [Paralcaligenes ureilyticus]TCT03077.1 putative spermidine/putrescine transport system ATP-binding protein/spermidine/putrescine transport system ATP-binding protein [Paralcaligenes ureilyticus]